MPACMTASRWWSYSTRRRVASRPTALTAAERSTRNCAGRGLQNCLHEKGHRNHPLNEPQKATNTRKSRIRARVEHLFGFQVQQMRANWIRTIGKIRAEPGIGLGNLVYNLFRYVQLGGSMV